MSDIAFQAVSGVPVTSVVMAGMNGETIEETGEIIIPFDDRYFIRPQFASRPDCFKMILMSGGAAISGPGNTFVKVDNDGYSSRIEYRSREDNFGFTYFPRFFINSVRLPFYLKEPRFAQSRNVYGMKSGRQKILTASMTGEFDMETDYIAESLHRKLIIALMHDEVYIDGKLLTQTGDYSIDWVNYLRDGSAKTSKGRCTLSANTVSRSSN